MGNGEVIPAATSAATSGAGTPTAAKETGCAATEEPTCGAAASLARSRLPRRAGERSAGSTDKRGSSGVVVVAFRWPPRPWKPAHQRRTTGAPWRLRLRAVGCSGLPSKQPGVSGVWLAHGRARRDREQPAKTAGGHGDHGRVGERLPDENGQ